MTFLSGLINILKIDKKEYFYYVNELKSKAQYNDTKIFEMASLKGDFKEEDKKSEIYIIEYVIKSIRFNPDTLTTPDNLNITHEVYAFTNLVASNKLTHPPLHRAIRKLGLR